MNERVIREVVTESLLLNKKIKELQTKLAANKEKIRNHSAGDRWKYSLTGLGQVTVFAKRTDPFRDYETQECDFLGRDAACYRQ